MAEGVIRRVPFTIAQGASKSTPVDIGPNATLVAVHLTQWITAAQVSFEAYRPGSGFNEPGGWDPDVGANTGGPWDANAKFDPMLNEAGVQVTIGASPAVAGPQRLGLSTDLQNRLQGARAVRVVSGTSASPIAQASLPGTGYLLVRAWH